MAAVLRLVAVGALVSLNGGLSPDIPIDLPPVAMPVGPVDPTLTHVEESDREEYRLQRLAEDELKCLALNIYHEARSEPNTGQMAVAAVTLNRVRSSRYPSSVCGVVKQGGERRGRCQFSWWCDGRSDDPTEPRAWAKARETARLSLLGQTEDPTDGATHYHASYVRPSWASKLEKTARIGQHHFYRAEPRRPLQLASVGLATVN